LDRQLTREEAARTLGVSIAADADTCKRAYRRLAREHHPDLGGDASTFHALQVAFEHLVDDEVASRPVVARGRPSTPPVSFRDETERRDLDRIDWERAVPAGRLALDHGLVARILATGTAPVNPLVATSRSPGSRLNGAAHLLAPELTSRLTITAAEDDRHQPVVTTEILTGNRKARRALDQVTMADGWVRRRRPSTTSLSVSMARSQDPRATALRVADHLQLLLDRIGWPLPAWTLERE
jgi:hypothetical protein